MGLGAMMTFWIIFWISAKNGSRYCGSTFDMSIVAIVSRAATITFVTTASDSSSTSVSSDNELLASVLFRSIFLMLK